MIGKTLLTPIIQQRRTYLQRHVHHAVAAQKVVRNAEALADQRLSGAIRSNKLLADATADLKQQTLAATRRDGMGERGGGKDDLAAGPGVEVRED
jgi:hypothetical protein